MKILRRIGKFLLYLILSLILLSLVLIVAVQIPFVQNWAVDKVTAILSDNFGTEVKVGGVDIDFFKTAVLEDVFVADQKQDTLLYARRFSVDIGVLDLFGGEIYVNDANLDGAVVKLIRSRSDTVFNYQFLVDAFTGTPADTTASDPWTFGIGRVSLENVRFHMMDEGAGRMDLNARFSSFTAAADQLDLENQEIALDRVALDGSKVIYHQLQRDSAFIPEPDTAALVFPGFGWTITAGEISMSDNFLAFHDDNAPRIGNALDYSHLELEDLQLEMDDFRYADEGISAGIEKLSFRDHSSFKLDLLKGEVAILPTGIIVEDFVLETPESSLSNDTRISFSEFSDLNDFMNEVSLETGFFDTRLSVKDLLMIAPAIRDIEGLVLPDEETLMLEGRASLDDGRLNIENFNFSTGEEVILQASGSVSQLMTDPYVELEVRELSASYNALRRYTEGVEIPEGLREFGRFTLSGDIAGTLDKLKAENLQLITSSTTRFSGNLAIDGLPDIDQANFSLQIDELVTRSEDLRGFSPDPLPPQLDSLGRISFSGVFNGTIRDFDIDGQFSTSAGSADTDLSMQFSEDYAHASYKGELKMEGFDLGKVLGDTSQFGKVSLSTTLDGSGLTLDSLNTEMKGNIVTLEYQGYTYNDLKVDGRFKQMQFYGEMSMNDENLSFDLSGDVNLSDSLTAMNASIRLDTVNLKNLNLMEQDIGVSGLLNAKISGTNLDDLRGTATLTNFALSNEDNRYFDKKIELQAKQLDGGNQSLVFSSNFTKASIEGKYKFTDLPDLVLGYVNDFYPVEELALPPDSLLSPRPSVADQQFTFDIQFTDLASVVRIFIPEFEELDTTAFLRGSFDSSDKQLEISGVFPNISYQNMEVDSLFFSSTGNRRRLLSSVAFRNLNFNNTFYASHLIFDTRMNDDTLHFDVDILDDTLKTIFKWGGVSAELPKDYALVFDEIMVLNEDEWNVDPGNMIRFSSSGFTIRDLVLEKGQQTIGFSSSGTAPEGDLAPMEIRFDNFRLKEVSALLNNPTLRLTGSMNGALTIKEPQQNLHYNAGLTIRNLTLNEQSLGDFNLEAAQPPGREVIDVMARLQGDNNMVLQGSYHVRDSRFDLSADIDRLSLVVADPFMQSLIRESRGYISGNFTVQGTADKPIMRGTLTTHDISTVVVITGTRYRSDGSKISITENIIDLNELVLEGQNGRQATITGDIKHEYFDNIRFNIRARTDGLKVLDTTKDDNPLYYGRLFASADVRIGGTADLPKIDVYATTLDSSLLHVEPLSTELAVVQEDYVIFANPSEYQPDSLSALEKELGNRNTGFELTLTLIVTPEAGLNIIIDPLTGDELFCTGRGNFTVLMNPAGNINITGTYVIQDGTYSFSYEGLVKREFEIRSGSSLTFTGDPYSARFDITAVYETRASTYELISNEATLDDATLAASQRRTDVEVHMDIDGNLAEPEITFDIQLPENQGGAVDNLVERKLVALRDEPSELNKQVFGLLLFNSFIQSETGAGLANVGENAALKSVSGLITSQLNRLADRFIKGVDLTLGFESYKAAGQDAGTITELQVGLSKQLFSNRLTIQVGGNFNLENSQQSSLQEGGYSAIAGDFVLEYKLNERGNYLLKVFHENDYNILLDANTNKTGIGIMYRKSY